jgi:hypothetical protein
VVSNKKNPPLETSQLSENIFLNQWIPKEGIWRKNKFQKREVFQNQQIWESAFEKTMIMIFAYDYVRDVFSKWCLLRSMQDWGKHKYRMLMMMMSNVFRWWLWMCCVTACLISLKFCEFLLVVLYVFVLVVLYIFVLIIFYVFVLVVFYIFVLVVLYQFVLVDQCITCFLHS